MPLTGGPATAKTKDDVIRNIRDWYVEDPSRWVQHRQFAVSYGVDIVTGACLSGACELAAPRLGKVGDEVARQIADAIVKVSGYARNNVPPVPPDYRIVGWNDSYGRKVSQVIGMLNVALEETVEHDAG